MAEFISNLELGKFRHVKALTSDERLLLSDHYLFNPHLSPQEIKEHVANVAKHGLLKVYLDPKELNTPLHRALDERMEGLALEMIAQGAPLNVKNGDEAFPIYIACDKRLEDAALAMIARDPPFHAARPIATTTLYRAMGHDLERVALSMLNKMQLRDNNGFMLREAQLNGSATADAMIEEFVDHCILPIYLLESNFKQQPLLLPNKIKAHLCPPLSIPKTEQEFAALDEQSPFVQDFFRLPRLTRTRSHPTMDFPSALLPAQKQRHWHSILPNDIPLEGGLRLTCLTDTDMLKKCAEHMHNCLGKFSYVAKCCETSERERIHLLAIVNEEGTPLSVMEVKLVKKDVPSLFKDDITIGNTDYVLQQIQHEGKNKVGRRNTAPPSLALKAWDICKDRIERGEITFETNSAKLGETQASKDAMAQVSTLTQKIGFEIDGDHPEKAWAMASACFNEYRRADRRASLDRPESRKRVYDDIETEYGPRQSHFIQGYALVNADRSPTGKWALHKEQLTPEAGQMIIDLRRLPLKSWLRATGLMEEIERQAGKVLRKDNSPLTIGQTPEESRAAHRYNTRGVEARGVSKKSDQPYFQR